MMAARSGHLGAVLCILLVQLLASTRALLDIRQPILRSLPSPDNQQTDGLFGYTLVLHQVDDVPSGDRTEALENTRIVVSAPKLTVPNSAVSATGAVYTCEVNPVTGGQCEGLMGNGMGVDRRLYDIDDNEPSEFKSDQFLGGSMASNADSFIVCANRFADRSDDPDTPLPVGRCYATTNQQLSNFELLQLCPVGLDSLGNGGICVAGTSSAITADGDDYTYSIGAPGYFGLRGVIIRMTPTGNINRMRFEQGTFRDSYQGYTVISGRFQSLDSQDYAVSVPKLENYFGRVNIVTNSTLSVVSQPELRGQQLGEYYGFSLLRANIQGDELDELLVGAPMYRANATEPETGRVYVYNNVRGSLTLSRRIIEGFSAFSRFGYAMANLGDINRDGFDDIAISAPFTSNAVNASGSVYIYYGGNPIQNPVQVIIGSDLSLTGGLSSLRGFGTSLASGVDVDENTFDDLAIGSFLSQQVFLLRTRPLAFVTQTLTASPQIVDLEQIDCPLDGTMYACFDVMACATFTGDGVAGSVSFVFTVTADANNVEQRITFDMLNSPMVTRTISVNRDSDISNNNCLDLTAFVLNSIMDRFNPFIIDFNVDIVEVDIPTGNGNVAPMDFSTVPVVSTSGVTNLPIETLKNCDGSVCIPDLRIGVAGYRLVMLDGSESDAPVLTLGAVRNVIVNTDVENDGEDAFLATITVSAPSLQFEIVRLSGTLTRINGSPNNGNFISLICPPELRENVVENGVDITRVTCQIGNPLEGPGFTLRVATTLSPRPELVGNEGAIDIGFTVTSVNPEDAADVSDGSNAAMGAVEIRAAADITLDPVGTVFPEQISYSNNVTTEAIENVTQLGPFLIVTFVVRNSGPSTVRNIDVVISWPLQTLVESDIFFLYPAVVPSVCQDTNINPANLGLEEISQVDDQPTNPGSGGKKRRKRRNAVFKREEGKRLLKRQSDPTITAITTNRTVTCQGEVAGCVPISCAISGLQGGGSVAISITAFLDERAFAESIDRFTIIPTAEVAIVSDEFLVQAAPDSGKTSMATVRVISAIAPVIVDIDETDGGDDGIPWYAIFLPILAAFIIIGVIAAALWGLGFFRRRKHEELKERKEELENLEKNGSGPDTSSTDNLTEGTNM